MAALSAQTPIQSKLLQFDNIPCFLTDTAALQICVCMKVRQKGKHVDAWVSQVGIKLLILTQLPEQSEARTKSTKQFQQRCIYGP